MQNLFILGSNSFAGSSFVNYVNKLNKYRVIAISRSKENKQFRLPYKWNDNQRNIKFYNIDINKNSKKLNNLLNKYKPEYFIDFASQGMVNPSWDRPEDWYRTNIVSKSILYKFILEKKFIKKYLRISTPEVYGSTNKKITESHNYKPSTPYAISHAAMDMHLKILNEKYNFPVVFIRSSNFYGPGQQLYRLIPKAIYCALNKKKFYIEGDGLFLRSFIYTDDFCDAFYKTLTKGKTGEIYHATGKEYLTVKDVVKKIYNRVNLNYDSYVIHSEGRVVQDQAYKLKIAKIKKELNYSPKCSIDYGIEQTFNWVENNLRKIKKNDLSYIHKK